MALTKPQQMLTGDRDSWLGASLFSAKQLTRQGVEYICCIAEAMRVEVAKNGGAPDLCTNKILACVFYEPSTRTRCSFEAAMYRLGGRVINVQASGSSIQKGESLIDTIQTMQSYCDGIVLRHSKANMQQQIQRMLQKPLLNAGDGIGEHPTQALLDIFTIENKLKRLDELNVTFVGDLKHGRTVHSLVRLLQLFSTKSLNFIAPNDLQIPSDILSELNVQGIKCTMQSGFTDELLQNTDVLYVTRIQKERFASHEEYERLRHSCIVTNEVVNKGPSHMIVMHPLPRVDELLPEVDSNSRAVYFEQMKNGMFTRMALLALILGADITSLT